MAVITNQVDALQKKGIDAVALGRAAGNSKSSNFRQVFQDQGKTPEIAFALQSIFLEHQQPGASQVQVDNTATSI